MDNRFEIENRHDSQVYAMGAYSREQPAGVTERCGAEGLVWKIFPKPSTLSMRLAAVQSKSSIQTNKNDK